jgi:ferredoxin-NADP reductase
MRLSEIDVVTHDVKTFRFTPLGGGDIPFQYLPGQFLTLRLTVGGIPIRRSYTIASSPTWRDRIEITVERAPQGVVSRFLYDELKVGDEVEIEAPNGTFAFDGGQAESVALVAAGGGITPMVSVALPDRDRLVRQHRPDPRVPRAARLYLPGGARATDGAGIPI